VKGIKGLLLDLDGTLVDIKVSFFLDTMMESMVDYFIALLDPETFRRGLIGSIDELISSPRSSGETNQDGFYDAFFRLTGLSPEAAQQGFDAYYRDVFPGFSEYGSYVDGALDLIESAHERGFALALATNPIFPRAAVLERMSWGNLSPDPFTFIAALENTRACKPQIEFFTAVADALDLHPEQCLMVGNDVAHDLAASSAGMRTYLAEPHLVREDASGNVPDGRGLLRDLGRTLGLW